MINKNIIIVIIIVVVIVGVGGLMLVNNANNEGNMVQEENAEQASTPTTHEISMSMMMYKESGGFSDAAIVIKKGDSITWKNMEDMTHTVTSDNGLFGSNDMNNGNMFTYTFNETGEFPYHCTYHKMMGMIGKVVVQ